MLTEERKQELYLAVQGGAAYLDIKFPYWHDHIDVTELDAGNFDQCVLGQLYDGYFQGLDTLGLNAQQAVDLGFDLAYGNEPGGREWDADREPEWDYLTQLWREQVED